jgi:6-pyruvoyltetrahydropterin/6-carboxytetrahydropterin synthase
VCDFKVVGELAGDFVRRYDHALCMNTADPKFAEFRAAYGERVIGFENRDPTTEVIAREISDRFTAALAAARHESGRRYPVRGCVRLVRVRVWETSSSWAEYEA